MHYVVGLGANLGSPVHQLSQALEQMEAAGADVLAVSPLYDSEPVGPPQPRFVNAAARVDSPLAPPALLALLHEIEARLGRVRRERWGPRLLDLDILWCETTWSGPQMTIPHPRLSERWFALKPLLDVAPELQPVYGPALARLAQPAPPRLAEPNAWSFRLRPGA
jgi:2-amino-4-hydroxy-6-hydroxymethyldihydropteridine diphosphokinase